MNISANFIKTIKVLAITCLSPVVNEIPVINRVFVIFNYVKYECYKMNRWLNIFLIFLVSRFDIIAASSVNMSKVIKCIADRENIDLLIKSVADLSTVATKRPITCADNNLIIYLNHTLYYKRIAFRLNITQKYIYRIYSFIFCVVYSLFSDVKMNCFLIR